MRCDDMWWWLQVEELEEKLLDQTQEVERLRSELVRPRWTTFLRNPGKKLPMNITNCHTHILLYL